MSTHLNAGGQITFLAGFGVTLSREKARFGFQDITQPAATAGVNAAAVGREATGLVSLLGKYNDDRSWEGFSAFLEQYRREIDEMNRE